MWWYHRVLLVYQQRYRQSNRIEYYFFLSEVQCLQLVDDVQMMHINCLFTLAMDVTMASHSGIITTLKIRGKYHKLLIAKNIDCRYIQNLYWTCGRGGLTGQLHDRYQLDFGLLFHRYLHRTIKQWIEKKDVRYWHGLLDIFITEMYSS